MSRSNLNPMADLVAVLAVLTALTMVWSTASLEAQQSPSSESSEKVERVEREDGITDEIGEYVVQEGDTLEDITERHLGTPSLWHENAKLNPEIPNPNRIYPGQRIRVLRERSLPAERAEIRDPRNDVTKNLQDDAGWIRVAEDGGDVLGPGHGVKTGEESSAVLHFHDTSSLHLTELSVVYLRNLETTLTGVRRGQIEIEQGQAEVEVRSRRANRDQIEIVVGDTVARPRIGVGGQAQTRARKSEDGSSRVMVYGGNTEVESGGAALEVPRGQGTVVPVGEPPKPPERLLPKAIGETPARGSRWDYGAPLFRWRTVRGAASYTLEICADAACNILVRRRTGLGTESDDASEGRITWQPDASLPRGAWHWRTTAVSPSGLDGYPGNAIPFEILNDRADLGPPVVVAALAGAGEVGTEGILLLSRDSRIRLAAHDDVAGVAEVRYRWNGGAWRTWNGGLLEPPTGEGVQELELTAEDHLGKVSEVWTLDVERDDTPPEPPSVSWEGADKLGGTDNAG